MTNSDADHHALRARGWATKKGQGDVNQNESYGCALFIGNWLVFNAIAQKETDNTTQHKTQPFLNGVCLFVCIVCQINPEEQRKKHNEK